MFFVIDKSKIFSYVIAICTVVILFVAAANLNNISSSENTISTSTNSMNSNIIDNSNTITNTINNSVMNTIN